MHEFIFLACKYCISGMGDVITWINGQSALTKCFFKIMQCAFNLRNSGILWSHITTVFKFGKDLSVPKLSHYLELGFFVTVYMYVAFANYILLLDKEHYFNSGPPGPRYASSLQTV